MQPNHSFMKVVLYFKPQIGPEKFILLHRWSNWGSSVEVNCTLVTKRGVGKVRSLVRVEIGIRWGFNPINNTITSFFSSVAVWDNLVNSPLRVIVESCRLLYFLLTGRRWYLRSCLGSLKIRLLSFSGYWYGSGVGGLEFSSIEGNESSLDEKISASFWKLVVTRLHSFSFCHNLTCFCFQFLIVHTAPSYKTLLWKSLKSSSFFQAISFVNLCSPFHPMYLEMSEFCMWKSFCSFPAKISGFVIELTNRTVVTQDPSSFPGRQRNIDNIANEDESNHFKITK